MSQGLWHQIEADGFPAAFPKQPLALAIAQVHEGDQLVVVGGASSEQGSSTSSGELADLCIGRCGVSPTDLWAKPLPSFSAVRAGKQDESPQGFARTVLAFPPRPRCGFSLTPLDSSGLRFLLLGGHTGQSGQHGHRLADAHLLEFVADLDSSDSPKSSGSGESEEIFFASDYKVELKERSHATQEVCPVLAKTKVSEDADSQGESKDSSDQDESEEEDSGAAGDIFRKTLQEVSRLGCNAKLKMKRRMPRTVKAKSPTKVRPSGSSIAEKDARWRLPHQEGIQASARFGHTAILQSGQSEHPSVLVYGGLDDGGVPLGDVYEVRVVESPDQPLTTEWCCLDSGDVKASSIDGAAPWDLQQRPRPRACHSAIHWDNEVQPCMVTFGGLSLGLEGEPRTLGDTWTFVCSGTASGSWKRPVAKGGAPAKRWGHGACLTGKSSGIMLLCGGIDANGKELSDCWVLDLEDMRWEFLQTLSHSPLHRSLLRANSLTLHQHENSNNKEQPELGRCAVTWSFSLKAAVIWSGHGFWTCCVNESSSPQRQPALEGSRVPPGIPPGRKITEYVNSGCGHSMVMPELPDVLPPQRLSKWAPPVTSTGLSRVQSEPGRLDSWRQASCLVRDPMPPGSILDSKAIMHRPACADRSHVDLGFSQWHPKHSQSRLEPLPPR